MNENADARALNLDRWAAIQCLAESLARSSTAPGTPEPVLEATQALDADQASDRS